MAVAVAVTNLLGISFKIVPHRGGKMAALIKGTIIRHFLKGFYSCFRINIYSGEVPISEEVDPLGSALVRSTPPHPFY
jgi:hypothetical protein